MRQLQQELRKSVQQRIKTTSILGRHKSHGMRQAAEQELIIHIAILRKSLLNREAHFMSSALIDDLLGDPSRFDKQGRAYDLLQNYFRGYPVETLRPLLANKDQLIQRAAVWIVSELGKDGCSLLDAVIPLIDSHDRYIKYHALEIAIVCSVDGKVDRFAHVARSLESSDEEIRILAMRLISVADQCQLEAGARVAGASPAFNDMHKRGLLHLCASNRLDGNQVLQMINDANPLVRRYGAIAARRLFETFPDLISTATESADPDISRFAKETLDSFAGE